MIKTNQALTVQSKNVKPGMTIRNSFGKTITVSDTEPGNLIHRDNTRSVRLIHAGVETPKGVRYDASETHQDYVWTVLS